MPLFLTLLVLCVFAYWLWKYRKHHIRKKLLRAGLKAGEWEKILSLVPLYHKAPQHLRPALEGKINLFLDQVEFIGCNGLDVTEEMELSIAAQACLLIANKDMWYKDLQTVLIYPNAFKSTTAERDGYVVKQREVVRIGESWVRGPVILSWAHSEKGAFIDDDGHNVVFHEFAHQLDALSGYTDGAPVLKHDHSQGEWGRVFHNAFGRLVKKVQAGRKTSIDRYGATAPEEFFAVVVELFFERPSDLKNEEPDVFEQLTKFFALDPTTWEHGN